MNENPLNYAKAFGQIEMLIAPAKDNHTVRLTDLAAAISYSSDEKLTTGTWIDGKPIYKRTVVGTLGQTDGETSTLAAITGIAALVKKEQKIKVGNKVYDGWTVPEASTANMFYIGVDESTGAITTYWTGYSSYAGAEVTVTLYYTKA